MLTSETAFRHLCFRSPTVPDRAQQRCSRRPPRVMRSLETANFGDQDSQISHQIVTDRLKSLFLIVASMFSPVLHLEALPQLLRVLCQAAMLTSEMAFCHVGF